MASVAHYNTTQSCVCVLYVDACAQWPKVPSGQKQGLHSTFGQEIKKKNEKLSRARSPDEFRLFGRCNVKCSRNPLIPLRYYGITSITPILKKKISFHYFSGRGVVIRPKQPKNPVSRSFLDNHCPFPPSPPLLSPLHHPVPHAPFPLLRPSNPSKITPSSRQNRHPACPVRLV